MSDSPAACQKIEQLVTEFHPWPQLRQWIIDVLRGLPADYQQDLLEDPRFRITPEIYEPGRGWKIHVASPGGIGDGSRCVVLRPRLQGRSEAFGKYVIAHELAHAYLRNGGWKEITDEEHAADELAASWGFVRPISFF